MSGGNVAAGPAGRQVFPAGGFGAAVVVVAADSVADDSTLELLGAARLLAEGRTGRSAREVTVLTLGATVPENASLMFQAGADHVVAAVAPWLADPAAEARVSAITETVALLKPSFVVMAHGAAAWEAAPRLSVRLDAGLVTDCVAIATPAGEGPPIATRPCFSGKALSDWSPTGDRPLIITLRKGTFAPARPDPSRTGEVSILEPGRTPPARIRTLSRQEGPANELRLEDAEVVIGVGRGVGSSDEFRRYFLEGLAPALGAACGGSRGAVDLGIIPPELQIGLTGRIVSPKLYLAVGLSGSPQHMAGCSGSQEIVAINTDPLAPIFGYAGRGVVGDYRRVVPALTERLLALAATRL